MTTESARRPLKVRQSAWVHSGTKLLIRAGISPNTISIASVLFAVGSGAALCLSANRGGAERAFLLVVAAAGLQMRLLCNLFDGMVAVEGGRRSKSGEAFNELPDRLADLVIFIGAGYAAGDHRLAVELGLLAAALAIFTAYARLLGGACGLTQSFAGPMAKQQRMAVMTAACLSAAMLQRLIEPSAVIWWALIFINVGCVITIWRRSSAIIRGLEAR